MEFRERMNEITKDIHIRNYEEAYNKLLQLYEECPSKEVKEEGVTHYKVKSYVESTLFLHYFRPDPTVPNRMLEIDIIEICYLLGYVCIEMGKIDEAITYLKKAMEFNPMDVETMFELAFAYRKLSDEEKAKAQIDRAYKYIYAPKMLARYYRELAWHFSEKKMYNVANALYTISLSYFQDNHAYGELEYIAKQENREPKLTEPAEVKRILAEYNISTSFDDETIRALFDDYMKIKDDPKNQQNADDEATILYEATLDKSFIRYIDLTDKDLNVKVTIPMYYKFIPPVNFQKAGISPGTVFAIISKDGGLLSVTRDDLCTMEEFDERYEMNKSNLLQNGITIEAEYSIDGMQKIKQLFVNVPKNDGTSFRLIQNYLIVSGRMFCMSWTIPNGGTIEQHLSNINNSDQMQVVWSLRPIEGNNSAPDDVINILNTLNGTGSNVTPKEEKKASESKIIKCVVRDYPYFYFQVPDNYGEQVSDGDLVNEIKVGKVQKLRISIIKANEETWKEGVKNWIEKTRATNDQKLESYSSEKVNDIDIERYILVDKEGYKKIYKAGFVKGYRVMISGGMVNNKEAVIDNAFKTMKIEERKEEATKNVEKHPVHLKCTKCESEFDLSYNVPDNEKTIYCKCPNCSAEISVSNPNFKE